MKIWNNYAFDYLSFLRSLDAFGRVKSFFFIFSCFELVSIGITRNGMTMITLHWIEKKSHLYRYFNLLIVLQRFTEP